eukprot:768811-Hanusia_phi.AAC.4
MTPAYHPPSRTVILTGSEPANWYLGSSVPLPGPTSASSASYHAMIGFYMSDPPLAENPQDPGVPGVTAHNADPLALAWRPRQGNPFKSRRDSTR